MFDKLLCEKYTRYLKQADITVDGDKPWDIQIKDKRLYRRVFLKGTIGFGEAYMDGWWDCPELDQFFTRLFVFHERTTDFKNHYNTLYHLSRLLFNFQGLSRARQVAEVHYDIGNDLFRNMLDTHMNYSCGYWKDAHNLNDAQISKMELVCKKLKLEPGMRVLDIGCGWGGMARYMAKHYKVFVVGITISQKQLKYAQQQDSSGVEFRLQDYRKLSEKFDCAYSIGMFEHVGYKNYADYMRKVRELLPDDGLFLLHTIGSKAKVSSDPWLTKYIFPNGMLPNCRHIGNAIEGLFVLEDWQNFGHDYSHTLMAWMDNFNKAWKYFRQHYDERFYRMWHYYLLSCAGSFRSRSSQLWQVVLSPQGVDGTYRAPR